MREILLSNPWRNPGGRTVRLGEPSTIWLTDPPDSFPQPEQTVSISHHDCLLGIPTRLSLLDRTIRGAPQRRQWVSNSGTPPGPCISFSPPPSLDLCRATATPADSEALISLRSPGRPARFPQRRRDQIDGRRPTRTQNPAYRSCRRSSVPGARSKIRALRLAASCRSGRRPQPRSSRQGTTVDRSDTR